MPVLRGAQQIPTAVLPLIFLKFCVVSVAGTKMVIYHSEVPPNPDLCIHQSTRKRLNHASHSPNLPYPHMVPGEEVKDLLLAAGDSSKSFHDGTRCLPCCLCRWGKEYLPDTGEEIGLAQRPPCFSRPRT